MITLDLVKVVDHFMNNQMIRVEQRNATDSDIMITLDLVKMVDHFMNNQMIREEQHNAT